MTFFALIFLTGCSLFNASKNHNEPKNLIFQNNNLEQKITVKRDSKLCQDETKSNQNCEVYFYIDNFKAGDFYINNKANFYLNPNKYTLKVKNCKTECYSNELVINLEKNTVNLNYIISLDEQEKPYIYQVK